MNTIELIEREIAKAKEYILYGPLMINPEDSHRAFLLVMALELAKVDAELQNSNRKSGLFDTMKLQMQRDKLEQQIEIARANLLTALQQ